MTSTPIRKIQHTWVSTNKACTLIIAKELAVKHGLTEPTNVILEDTPNGILIRKLNLEDVDLNTTTATSKTEEGL